MNTTFTAHAATTIRASAERVWDALTNPALIKQYLFGTETATDWKVGSPITYRGTWQGKSYEDKGTILENVPLRLLRSTYWSSMSGLPDRPENYNTVTWELSAEHDETTLRVAQDNCPSRESAEHSEANWRGVLDRITEILERASDER